MFSNFVRNIPKIYCQRIRIFKRVFANFIYVNNAFYIYKMDDTVLITKKS